MTTKLPPTALYHCPTCGRASQSALIIQPSGSSYYICGACGQRGLTESPMKSLKDMSDKAGEEKL